MRWRVILQLIALFNVAPHLKGLRLKQLSLQIIYAPPLQQPKTAVRQL